MKYFSIVFFLVSYFSSVFAQDQFNQSDSISDTSSAKKQNHLFIKLNSVHSYGIIKSNVQLYNFKSMFGTGVEFTIGFKLNPKAALGFGFQRSQFFLNPAKVERALSETYSTSWMSANVTAMNQSYLKQMAYFIYLSAWKQRSRNIFEYYVRVFLTSYKYDLNSMVHRTAMANDTIVTKYEGGLSNSGIMAAMGFNYSRQISKIFYVGGGLQYGFNFMPKSYLYEHNRNSAGTEVTYQIQLPVPSHLMQVNIGMMYRPKKACNCKEQKPW